MIISSPYRNRGFTLIEMMVSVAIFGVMASIIFPALIQFLDARDRIDEKHQQIVGMQKTFLFLAQDLRFASNRLGKDEFGGLGKSTLRVNEGENLVELTALYPDLNLNGLGVPRRVKWVLEGTTLQRIQYPVMDPDQDTRIIRQNLMENVENVKITLMHILDGSNVEADTWESESRLPDTFEIVVTLESDIEYRRVFTMLSGDKLQAIAAALSAGANTNPGDGADSDNDVGDDSGAGGNDISPPNQGQGASVPVNPDAIPPN